VHFLHIKSSHEHAIPLLLLPSFPIPNLSPLLAPLFKSLTEPSLSTSQPFHLVVPSIPGLGFSDPLQSDENLLAQTAEIFNIIMTQRLGYEFYLTTSTGSGRASPAGIDYHLARLISENYPEHCLGAQLIEPLVQRPSLGSFWAWTKFTVAKFFHASIFGYTTEDFHSLRENANSSAQDTSVTERSPLLAHGDSHLSKYRKPAGFGVVGTLGLREPNTLSYALCDSPVGLLSLVCSALRRASPNHTLNSEEIIDITQMAWLPGPEAGMRFWSCAVEEVKTFEKQQLQHHQHGSKRRRGKARVAVTVFSDTDGSEEGYVCPAWVQGRFEVVHTQRVIGRAGLIAYEYADVVVDGVRGLARGVDAVDGRLKLARLEGVVVGGEANGDEEHVSDESFVQWDTESPSTVVGGTAELS
jgi:hypothetical protein